MVVPAGTQHQFVNSGPTPLVASPLLIQFCFSKKQTIREHKLTASLQIFYTIYSPAEHDPQTVHKTKEESEKEEEKGHDKAPDWSQKSKAENQKNGLVNESGKY